MINITLICAAGMSTSMLVAKMKEAAEKDGVEANIIAMGESAFMTYDGPTDVLLLGPQIGHLLKELEKNYADRNLPMAVIDFVDYGMMNGKKVLDSALKMAGK